LDSTPPDSLDNNFQLRFASGILEPHRPEVIAIGESGSNRTSKVVASQTLPDRIDKRERGGFLKTRGTSKNSRLGKQGGVGDHSRSECRGKPRNLAQPSEAPVENKGADVSKGVTNIQIWKQRYCIFPLRHGNSSAPQL
jgi:hypothetical protein